MHLKINPKRVDFDVHPKSILNAGIASSKIACLSTRIFGRASLLGTNMEQLIQFNDVVSAISSVLLAYCGLECRVSRKLSKKTDRRSVCVQINAF